jgi:hypothetical protein
VTFSWLNLVEGFFSKLARSVLRHIRVASMERFVVTDVQWAKIEPHCLGKATDPGRTGGDGRLFLEAGTADRDYRMSTYDRARAKCRNSDRHCVYTGGMLTPQTGRNSSDRG